MKKNHTITYCKLFRKAREILKEQGNTLNVLAMAEEDANMQALNPVREALIDQLDWEAAQIDNGFIANGGVVRFRQLQLRRG